MAASKFTKPNHGTTVTIKGREYLFLDDGGFKGLYLSESEAALVLGNGDVISQFVVQQRANENPSKDPTIAAMEKRIADLTSMLGASRATALPSSN